jgi:hypothetical protein
MKMKMTTIEELLSDIASEYKAYAIPLAAAFPAVYAVFVTERWTLGLSHFDKVVFSIAVEIAVMSASTAVLRLWGLQLKHGAIASTVLVYLGAVAHAIFAAKSGASVPMFIIFAAGFILMSALLIPVWWIHKSTNQIHDNRDGKNKNNNQGTPKEYVAHCADPTSEDRPRIAD